MSRKLDLSQFMGDDSDEENSGAPKAPVALTDLKSRTFSHGITKKSRKDIEKEQEEKKRVEEEKAAALVLAEYTDAFDAGAPSGPSTFARGGFGRPAVKGSGFVRAGMMGAGGAYEPPKGPALGVFNPPRGPGGFEPPRGPSAMAMPPKGPSAMYGRPFKPSVPKEPSPPPSAGPRGKGKRAMDSFLMEIKGNQEAREQRLGKMAKIEGSSVTALAAWETEKGGRAVGPEESTNLFVSNLPGNITEETLGLFFAKIGPVGTVKVMWPRGDELEQSIGGTLTATRRAKAGLQGFVSFMKRKDAERGVLELDGIEWGGSLLRVGWSKPVPMPARAIYDLGQSSDTEAKKRDYSPKRERKSRSESRSPSPLPRRRSRSYSSSSSYSSKSGTRSPSPSRKLSAKEKWLAKTPAETEKFIRAVAMKVREHGKGFEGMLKEKEKDNPKFNFFFNEQIPDYHLYRSALSSRYKIPAPPPEDFDDDGYASGYASLYSTDSAEDSEKERTSKGKLGKLARKRVEAMLRALTGKRAEIARTMEFAMGHAECADEVAELVCGSLRLDGTAVPRKMARLYLVSDILHNSASSLPNVWRYRLSFEQRLQPVFAHLASVHQSLKAYSGNISADVFKSQVMAILEIWERWIVFNQDVNDGLRELFLGNKTLNDKPVPEENGDVKVEQTVKPQSAGFKSAGFKSSFKPLAAAQDDLDGEPLDDDLDGEAMDEDLDGEAIDDLDGEAFDDLDGEVMKASEALAGEDDGEAMDLDDELDGEAMT